jgi:hypothetical protein
MRANEFITETVNPDILDPRFTHTQEIGDYTYQASYYALREGSGLQISAYIGENTPDNRIGLAVFKISEEGWDGELNGPYLTSLNTWVADEFQKQGIASTMYAYAKMLGNDVRPSKLQLDPGKAMWKSWKKSGDAAHLVTEKENKMKIKDIVESHNKVDEGKVRLDAKCWDGYKKQGTKMKGGTRVNNCVKEELEETYDGDEFFEAYGEMWYNEDEQLDEADYHGRKVTLGKPMQGDVKKFKVYVKDPSTGNIKKVNFGDPNMRIKKSNPARRKSFRARHNCDNPGPRTKARYWSCRKW